MCRVYRSNLTTRNLLSSCMILSKDYKMIYKRPLMNWKNIKSVSPRIDLHNHLKIIIRTSRYCFPRIMIRALSIGNKQFMRKVMVMNHSLLRGIPYLRRGLWLMRIFRGINCKRQCLNLTNS
jgi:hypothetical protein